VGRQDFRCDFVDAGEQPGQLLSNSRSSGAVQLVGTVPRDADAHNQARFRWMQRRHHIDASINLVLRSALLRASRRTATNETEPTAILRDGASRLLRMRAVGLSSMRLIRLG